MCAQEHCCKSLKLEHLNPHRTCQQNKSCVSYPVIGRTYMIPHSEAVSSCFKFQHCCRALKVESQILPVMLLKDLRSLGMVWLRYYRQASCQLQHTNLKLQLLDLSPFRMIKKYATHAFPWVLQYCLVRERLCFYTKPLIELDNHICKTKDSEKGLRKRCQKN